MLGSRPSPCAALQLPDRLHPRNVLQTTEPEGISGFLRVSRGYPDFKERWHGLPCSWMLLVSFMACYGSLSCYMLLRMVPNSSIVSSPTQTAGYFCDVFVCPGMSLVRKTSTASEMTANSVIIEALTSKHVNLHGASIFFVSLCYLFVPVQGLWYISLSLIILIDFILTH